ncbi:MAG TPA: hypothetical protein PLZ08_09350 [Bacillota bacterium]|jgi:acyl-CoA reductase-like NAD-dependent aldehyde dehydrogenase|nr:hypothetical protein [Bacillota bacterium]HOL09901.1 hypothetical protein [Bacillota bacterium]HPO98143.1 hypothetical protein [Bacillota bacterium]
MNQVEEHLLSGFARINDFDFKNWKNFSLEQRVQLLQEAADYIAKKQNWQMN